MKEDIRKKLEAELERASWEMLKPHFSRQALFVVARDLDLVEVALALATNDVESVKAWQTSWKLRPPTDSEIREWQKDEYQNFAEFLVVQPFVFDSTRNTHALRF